MTDENQPQEPIGTGTTTTTETAPVEPVQEPVIETQLPKEDPRINQLLEQNRELTRMLSERNNAPATQQPAEAMPDIDGLIEQSFQNPETAAALKRLFQLQEQRLGNQFTPRKDFEMVRSTAYAVAANAAEQRAIDELRSRKIPEADIQAAQAKARQEANELQKQGLYAPPNVLMRAALHDVTAEKGYAAAEAAVAAKQRVVDRQNKAVVPQPAAPSGAGQSKITDEEMQGGCVNILKASRAKGLGPKSA